METVISHDRLKIPGGSHLTVEEHLVSGEFPLHWHSFFEIEIVLSGRGSYSINDECFDICRGKVFFLTFTDFHHLHTQEPTHLINISFDEAALGQAGMELPALFQYPKAYAFPPEDFGRLLSAAELLAHECALDGECRGQLLRYILACMARQESQPRTPGADRDRGIQRAIDYMQLHFREELTLAELARESGYHPVYFSELFKKATGQTCIRQLALLRLGYARSLLANGFSVSDACFLSGFGSLSRFLEVFKRECGMPPSAYRAKHWAARQRGQQPPPMEED